MRLSETPIQTDLISVHNLWMAALCLLLEDAADYLRKPIGPATDMRQQAYQDVTTCGPMLAHACRFCVLDPNFVRAQFLASLRASATTSEKRRKRQSAGR